MGGSFLGFLKQMGIFIICVQGFQHFTAGKAYEKYVKLLVGIMVLAQFAAPIRSLFLKGDGGELWEEVERFQKEMEDMAGDIVWDYEEENETGHMLEREIQEKLEIAASEYGFCVKDVKIEGEPPKVEVAIAKEEQREGRIQVEKIRVGSTAEGGKEKQNASATQYEEMRKVFSLVLHTDEAYIMIREE